MTFVSAVRPLCRYCGAGIKKVTHTHYFGASRYKADEYSTDHPEKPVTKADAQRLVNGQIVSIRRDTDGATVWVATTWDGESWHDAHFCGAPHARAFAYAIANHTSMAMQVYHDAIAARK